MPPTHRVPRAFIATILILTTLTQSFVTCLPMPVYAAATPAPSSSTSAPDRYAGLRVVPSVSATPLRPIPVGQDHIEYLVQGGAAPYSGYLYAPETALRWSNYLDQFKQLRTIDLDAQRRVGQACTDAVLTVAEAERARGDRSIATLRTENDRLSSELYNPPWYRTGTFYFLVGGFSVSVVFAAAFFIGSAFKR